MPTFEFRVLCSSGVACKSVMHGMEKNFDKVTKTPEYAISDHSAILKAKDADEAYEQAKKLQAQFKGKINDITVLSK